MLYIPSSSQRFVSIIGIDPGTNTLGCSVLDVDIDTLNICGIHTHTFVAETLPLSQTLEDFHGSRMARLYALQGQLTHMFNNISPLYIGCEAPFINVKRPQAYGALIQAVTTVRQAAMEYNPSAHFRLVEPLLVKTAVGAKTSADKMGVWSALTGIKEIMDHLGSFQPDEHSVDAIAVAYYVLKNLRVNPAY